MKRLTAVLLIFAVVFSLLPMSSAAASISWENVYTQAAPDAPATRVDMETIDGTHYLFLPAGCDVEALPLYFACSEDVKMFSIRGDLQAAGVQNGEAVNLKTLCGEQECYTVTLNARLADATAELTLTILPTGNISSLFLISDDPETQGREWVESSPDKSNKARGSMRMIAADGTTVYDGALTQIKGRGNSTWKEDKKPYQIKLKTKTDLLQTGDAANATKTWVLLANANDGTSLRNRIVYDLSVAMGMEPGIGCTPVNLYYDGEYRGVYLLSEKVEIGSGRVDIADLEEANEGANPDIDLEALSRATGQTDNGAKYIYCKEMQTPEEHTGGYLLEMDFENRAKEEACYFVTTRGNYVVVKSPEFCSQTEMDYIAGLYQDFEDTVFNGGTHPTNGKTLADYADIDSLAQCYIINELTKNPDGYRSSTFLYKDAQDAVFTAGPIWDYDLAFGVTTGEYAQEAMRPEGFFTQDNTEFAKNLTTCPQFRQAVHEIYLGQVAPLLRKGFLYGTMDTTPLLSFSSYLSELRLANQANALRWANEEDMEAVAQSIRAYIATRSAWLYAAFAAWGTGAGYADVLPETWYYDDVADATTLGILNGKENNTFAPEEQATRAQATKVLFAISDAEAPAFTDRFSDVSVDCWFAPSVLWAAENDVVKGYDDGRFGPEDNITRQDMVVLLYRFLGTPEGEEADLTVFTDVASIGSYATAAMTWAVSTGLIQGYEDTTLRPLAEITRAEMATLIVRFYETFIAVS